MKPRIIRVVMGSRRAQSFGGLRGINSIQRLDLDLDREFGFNLVNPGKKDNDSYMIYESPS